jgi:hypothetical protein
MKDVFSKFRKSMLVAAAFMGVAFATPIASPAEAANVQEPLIITNDGGGRLEHYRAKLRDVERTGRRVEIRGTCNSSCTIFLSASNVCVTGNAKLGFHGPRYLGDKLMRRDRFDHWSKIMASHYPRSIAQWYMKNGRYKIHGVKVMRGKHIWAHGIPNC